MGNCMCSSSSVHDSSRREDDELEGSINVLRVTDEKLLQYSGTDPLYVRDVLAEGMAIFESKSHMLHPVDDDMELKLGHLYFLRPHSSPRNRKGRALKPCLRPTKSCHEARTGVQSPRRVRFQDEEGFASNDRLCGQRNRDGLQPPLMPQSVNH